MCRGNRVATASKGAGEALLGVDGLRAIVDAAAAPVLAIGGVDGQLLEEIAAAGGAAGFARSACSRVTRQRRPSGCRVDELRQIVKSEGRGLTGRIPSLT